MLADGVVPGRSTSRTNNMDDYEHVYTTMRSDTTNSRVNVNTASYEALKGIQVNPEGTTPTFMTDEMAREIIETRSCESNYRFGDTLPVENYECNNNNPYVSTIQACEQLNTTAHLPSLDCDVFTKTTTVSSGGIFRAEVRGVVVEDGAVQSESIWEVMVDRTGVERPSGSLEIIFLRERDDL